jgi:DNA repair protein RecO (recombination protein O)
VAVYKANALVLRRIPLGETDKIVTLFTREYGKLSAVAKGARKTTSRLAGAAEPLMLLRALLAEGMNLDILTQCEIKESFPLLRGDFGLILRATYACELLDKLTVERDAAPEAFDLLLSTLYVLQRAIDPDAALHAFELQLLAIVGYEPRLDACARCGQELDEPGAASAFSPARGGLLCAACADATDDALPLAPDTARMMARLLAEDDARALAGIEMCPVVREETARLLRAHLRYRLERDVKSTQFLDAFRLGAMNDLEGIPSPPPRAG